MYLCNGEQWMKRCYEKTESMTHNALPLNRTAVFSAQPVYAQPTCFIAYDAFQIFVRCEIRPSSNAITYT